MIFEKHPYHHMLSYHMLNTMRLTKRIFSFFKNKRPSIIHKSRSLCTRSENQIRIYSTKRSLICTRSENQQLAYKTTKNNKKTLEIIREDDNYSQYSVN